MTDTIFCTAHKIDCPNKQVGMYYGSGTVAHTRKPHVLGRLAVYAAVSGGLS